MLILQPDAKDLDFKDHVLVLPSVSIGNIGQLAVDVLIENTSAVRIGSFEHDGLLPLVANSTDGGASKPSIVTSMDVFHAPGTKLLLIQQRAPAAKDYQARFRSDLCNSIKELGVQRVILVTGADAKERLGSQVSGPQHRFLLSSSLASEKSTLEDLGFTYLEERTKSKKNPDGIFIHGGGLARTLFQKLEASEMKVAAFIRFCSPGDNRVASMEFVKAMNAWLKIQTDTPDLKIPDSWKLF